MTIPTKSPLCLLALAVITLTSSARQTLAIENSKSAPVAAASSPATDTTLRSHYPRYRLRKGDSFEIQMEFSPEFNQTVVVQPDGFITLKGAGSLHAEGQTVQELTETIKLAYSKILRDPVLAISPKDFEMPYFIATGEVGKPGKYELRNDLTVTEAVALAGGFTEKSKHSEVVLFRPRQQGGGYDAKIINVKKLLKERNLSEDMQIQPGDLVYVPQNHFSKIRPFLPSTSTGAFLGPGVF
jgi:polysaccharide export outer membrane protein